MKVKIKAARPTHPSQCLQPEAARATERARVKRQVGLIYQRKQEPGYRKGGGETVEVGGAKKSVSVAGRNGKRKKKKQTEKQPQRQSGN